MNPTKEQIELCNYYANKQFNKTITIYSRE